MKLRCPRCGGGRLFQEKSPIRMYERCPNCKLKYERAPGYFLGSAYINYALTAVLLTIAYVTFHFGFEFSNEELLLPLIVFCIGFPILFFRYARSYWLAMDCFLDPVGFETDDGLD